MTTPSGPGSSLWESVMKVRVTHGKIEAPGMPTAPTAPRSVTTARRRRSRATRTGWVC